MKNNYEESDQNKLSQEKKEYYNSATSFYTQEEIDKKYNFYLSNFNQEKGNSTKNTFYPRRSEQIERLLEEEKNIEDENVQRLKELRNKYLSSVKTFDEEKEFHNYFTKNASYETEENKLWKINYSKKDLLNNNNSRNSLENINQIQIQNNTSNSNNEINIDINKINNSINAINNTLGINMSIYERKNSQNMNQSYNTYIKCNDFDFKSEENNKIIKCDNLIQDKIIENNTNIENDYNKLKNDYNKLQNDYMDLMEKYNSEKNKNIKKNLENVPIKNEENTYNDYIIKELDEMKKINANYEYIITPLINYINDIDYILDKTNLKKIDLVKIKKNIKILFPNQTLLNPKEHPLYPFIKLLDNYKNIIYNNDKIKNLNNNNTNKSNKKNSQRKTATYESILNSYNIKNNINNIKFKSMNSTKNKISRSIGATPNNPQKEKVHKIFSNRKHFNILNSDKMRNKSSNKIRNTMKNKNSINISLPKETK